MERQEIFAAMTHCYQEIERHKELRDSAEHASIRAHHQWWMGYERGRASGLKVAYEMAGGIADNRTMAAMEAFYKSAAALGKGEWAEGVIDETVERLQQGVQ